MSMTKPLYPFNPHSPVLVIAPHLTYPLRNGDDIAVDRHWGAFSAHVPFVTIVAADRVMRYENGVCVQETPIANRMRASWWAALRTLWFRSHYLLEKFITPAYLKVIAPFVDDPQYETIVYSHFLTGDVAPYTNRDRFAIMISHNDDFLWFQHLADHAKHPLARRVALLSKAWTERFVAGRAMDYWLEHVTMQDCKGYQQFAPDHRYYIMPPGVDFEPHQPSESPHDGACHILFAGSLSVTMNLDALQHFRTKFYPAMKQALGERLDVTVVGSNPTEAVRALCAEENWPLHANVSDAEMEAHHQQATFSILPFQYSTGFKLKLLKSLSYGVPFLATTHATEDFELPSCLVSDDPQAWVAAAHRAADSGIPMMHRMALLDFVASYAWSALAKRAFQTYQELQ